MKPSLQASSAHDSAAGWGGKKLLDHVLGYPDVYIGSVEKRTQKLWVYERGTMVHRAVTYIPGLHKIFDEILVNAAGHKRRAPTMDALRVEIDVAACCISVFNNGDGIPVEFHQEEGTDLRAGDDIRSPHHQQQLRRHRE